MSPPGKTAPEDFSVRLGQDEIGLIYNLKENLDYSDQLASHAVRYQELGWQPRALSASDNADLGMDFSLPEESLYERISASKQSGVRINLGLATPGAARLLVVETHAGSKIAALDQFGDWQSRCWANSEDGREQHYYLLPPGFSAPRTCFLPDFDIKVYGQEGMVLAPPSRLPDSPAVLQWATPPWEIPPDPPGPAIWEVLQEGRVFAEAPDPQALSELPDWEEIYHRIEPFAEIVRALVAPADSFEQYYERILNTALGFIIADPALLLGLLWHAPRGDVREYAPRWLYLQNLVAMAPALGLAVPALELSARARGHQRSGPHLQREVMSGSGRTQAPAAGRDLPAPPNEIVSYLEKRVTLERDRYESMISEMSELAAKAADLERRLEEQENRQPTKPSSAAAPEPPPAEPDPPPTPAQEPPRESGSGGAQAIFREFLAENPDLAGQDRVRMLQFYMKNYIDINPENHGLPFREKLARAAKMVRDFLGT
jgi:hypothetical protein